ncbi:hypothetical protein My1_097 [Pectobacterium phage My1]|uniref:Uncharacterized protein n=1 Tax=Pectobacterium phage My1 TaxID=1204539 RepID=J9QPW4_9CAUD|nr:hypothetical protein My1_097 [Pectobacterium phage My1]AFQ22256.1 hypothetical protein My1_097 [Pectobacterium phage My1]
MDAKVLKYKFIYGGELSNDELLLLFRNGDEFIARQVHQVISAKLVEGQTASDTLSYLEGQPEFGEALRKLYA